MSDAADSIVEVPYVNVGDHYAYPNSTSYGAMKNGALHHGQIFSVNHKTLMTGPAIDATGPATTSRVEGKVTDVNYQLYKYFQYNPSEVAMNVNATPVPPDASEADAGNNIQGMGAMSVSFEMRFTREQEVYAATNGGGGGLVLGLDAAKIQVYKNIGVMKDIYDVFRVILGEQAEANALPTDMSMRALTKKAFDLSAAGGVLYGRAMFVQFNPALAWYGYVTSFNFKFNKFNNRLVPVYAVCSLSLDVLHASPVSTIPGSTPTTATAPGSSSTGGTPSVTVGPPSNSSASLARRPI